MRARWGILGLTLALTTIAAAPGRAQQVDAQCTNVAIVGPLEAGGDACQKAADLYRYFNAQLGVLIAGGNATLGQGGTLGGPGHVSVGVRVNVINASVPDVGTAGIALGPPQRTAFTTGGTYAPLPELDAAIGIVRGIAVGPTHIGGVDALVSAAYLPSFSKNAVRVENSAGALRFGFGARLGVLQETALTPGLSVTWLRRDLPITTITASASATRTITVRDFDVRSTAWRVVASKSILGLGLAAGVGQDRYQASATLTYDVDGAQPLQPLSLDVKPTRTNMFADLSVNFIPLLKLVGEVGRVSGGTIPTYNTFGRSADAARWYGSLGARLAF